MSLEKTAQEMPVLSKETDDYRSLVLVAPKTLEVKEGPLPEPRAGEVRIKLEGSGICASNIHVWEGREWFSYPVPAGNPGHEGWGTIDAIGKGVTGFEIGERVTALSYNAYATHDVAEARNVV